MKKYIVFIAACFAALVSCTKAENIAGEKTYDSNDLEFVFDVSEPSAFGGATKSSKAGWTEGDKIYIAFDLIRGDSNSAVPQNLEEFLILQYTSGAWTVLQTPSIELRSSGKFDALYMDVEPNITFGGSSVTMHTYETRGQYMYLIATGYYEVSSEKIVTPTAAITLRPRENRVRQFCVTGLSAEPWSISFEVEGHSSHWGVDRPQFTVTNGLSYTSFSWLKGTNMLPMSQRTDGHYIWATLICENETVDHTVTVRLSNTTSGTFHKTFTKKIPYMSAISFDGPDNYTSPTNGWVRE